MGTAAHDSELLTSLLTGTTDQIYFKDLESRFIKVSDPLARKFGLAGVQEAYGKSDSDFFSAAHALPAYEDEQRIISSGVPLEDFEEEETWEDGRKAWVRTSKAPLRDGRGEIVGTFGITRDITAQKLAEQRLFERSIQLEQIAAAQRDIFVADHDLPRVLEIIVECAQAITAADGVLISMLKGSELVAVAAGGIYSEMLGTSRPLAGTGAEHAIAARRSFLAEEAEKDPRLSRELVNRFGTHSYICVPLFRGERMIGSLNVGSCSLERPLTDDDRLALDLLCVALSAAVSRESEFEALDRFQTIYNLSPIGIVLTNPSGPIVDANQAFQELTGYSLEELHSLNHFGDLLHPDDLEETNAWRSRMLAGDINGFQLERRYLRKDGSSVWTDCLVSYVRDSNGDLLAMTMVQDVSKRRLAEEQLNHVQKIEAVGQLTAGIAHDFNNLLMGVLGYIELASSEEDLPEAVLAHLAEAQQAGLRAAALTKQLLAFGRRQMIQPVKTDLNKVVTDTVAMLRQVLGEHITIELELGTELASVYCDPNHMEQVLVNLALNARDAMPAGGQLVVGTSNFELVETAGLDLQPGSYVELAVHDNGTGMSDEVRQSIFEPFFTTKDVGEGTGLGLSSVYGTIKQSQGEIIVESELGRGTSFYLYLPTVLEHASTPAVLSENASLSSPASPVNLI